MTAQDNIENKLNELVEAIGEDDALVENVMSRIETVPIAQAEKKSKNKLFIRRFIMNRFTKLAAVAVIIIAAIFSVTIFDKTIPTASAAELLTEAIEAVSDIQSVYIKARMRTLPHDNFMLIGLDYDFVPLEMWKEIDETGTLRWRIEKPLRFVVMDGEKATLLIRQTYASQGRCPNFYCYDVRWCGQLLNVYDLLDSELQSAQKEPDAELCMRHENIDGREKIVLEIETPAQGDYTNDYLKNKFLSSSDNLHVYYFDAETKCLEGFEIYVHADDEDILVFEITEIEYNLKIDKSLFTPELPEDVIWSTDLEVLPDNERYKQMTPKEAATVFFQACADQDWEEALKFMGQSRLSEWLKNNFGGLDIINIGEPFKSGRYPGWFVPYEIKLKNGQIRKHNLALRNDNKAKRFEVDGGI